MVKFAYVATGPDGRLATGVERAETRDAAELALYGRQLRDIRLSEKQGMLRVELSAPRVKREEVMHLSRQLGAFIRAGLPLIDAVHTLGEEATNSSVRRMMRQVGNRPPARDTPSDRGHRHPTTLPPFFRCIP